MRLGVLAPTLVLALSLGSTVALTEDANQQSGSNIGVLIRMGTLDGEKKKPLKTYRMVLEDNGPQSEMLIGARVAIPVTRFDASAAGVTIPATSYTYQNIGFTAVSRAWLLDDGRVKLDLRIEQSRLVGEAPPGGQPRIGTRNHSVQVVVEPGVPLEISRIDDPVLGSEYCEVVAEVAKATRNAR